MGRRVDIADDTFVVAAPAVVAAAVRDPAAWACWWPDLQLTVGEDRGVQGVRWSVAGALAGSMEIWLEPWADGTLLHWYLRAARVRRPPPPARGQGAVARPGRSGRTEVERRTRAWKDAAHALKDRLEAGRTPGDTAMFRDRPEVKDKPTAADP